MKSDDFQIQTEILRVSPGGGDDDALMRAGKVLRRGGLVAFPTETVYGLGADARDAAACAKIFAAKGRPQDNPLIVHIADPADAGLYCHTTPLYEKLAAAFMPGPLTVIMPTRGVIPPEVTAGLDSVGIRCPAHPVARRMLELSGLPVAAPSANLSGRPSPTTAAHVIADLYGRVDMIIDGGDTDIGLESTIVKITPDGGLLLLRPGAVTCDALLCVCDRVDISPAVTGALKPGERPLSPGMKYRHYAPKAPLFLLEGDEAARRRFLLEKAAAGENCLYLGYEEEALPGLKTLSIGKRDDFDTQARRLFACLREADALNVKKIYAPMPPRDGLGLALYNRLIRAAAHQVLRL